MKLPEKLFAAVAAVLLVSTSAKARTSYEFDWVGGQPGYGGKLFFDSPANPHGTPADILGGYIETPVTGVNPFNPATVFIIGFIGWDTTTIHNIHLDWSNGMIVSRALPTEIKGFGVSSVEVDDTGHWRSAASVPDAGNTFSLSVIAFLGAFALRQARTTNPAV